ncbi:cation-transporting P-type ATPase [Granulicoccus sp. GXG6511]|uniref:cation-transporting P-type ATPase n=1 Tax=Granulicoccus sp. GXG6511 TaxID=3381351 RepID=UPI003D7D415A
MSTEVAGQSHELPVHAQDVEEVVAAAPGGRDGLTAVTAAESLERHGPNALPAAERETALRRLLRQFHDPMIYVLLVAAVFTGVLGQVFDTIVILAVVLINAIVGFVQEGRAADALESIRGMLRLEAKVRRDGAWTVIPAEEVVPGDLVRLAAGDRIPADLRIVDATNLRIEESALTGESVPSEKAPAQVAADAALGDRSSMAYAGTTAASGSGRGIVTGTGTDTEIGRITSMLADVESMETPLTRAMTKFSKMLAVIAVGMAIAMAVIAGLVHRYPWAELVMASISFAVAAIPEGLPAVLTITLALGVQRMANRNAITRRMGSVETLGSVTTICSDKTGTLTRNEMTVRTVVTPADTYLVTGTGYDPVNGGVTHTDGTPATLTHHHDLFAMAEVAERANDATLQQRDDHWAVAGDPTDGGVRTFALKAGASGADQNRLAVVPFDSAHKYMATLDQHVHNSGELVIHLKGAPDRLLDRCDRQGTGLSTTEPLDRARWEEEMHRLGGQGLRVLAAAARRAEPGRTTLDQADVDAGGFVFLGLYGIIDPPRQEATEAIATVHRAGIDVKMITGDHADTARAIAREMGIGDRVITGPELERASDEELRSIVRDHDIYARTSPEHKLRLVTALQANGHVVAMTGDGVNDAPSLKRSDVGVAMGIKGTEATKDAADVVLADDNFASIAAAVEMGRTIYDNLKKAIVFMLPTNGGQGLVILTAMLVGMTLPITPLQVLWVNLITAITLCLALAFEPPEPGIMARRPRDPRESLLNAEAILRIAYVSVLIGGLAIGAFLLAQDRGLGLAESRTIAVNTLVVGQIFYLLAARFSRARSLRKELLTTNPISWVCIGIMIALQLAFVHLPFMQIAFGTTDVGLADWVFPALAGVLVFALVEIDKAIRRALEARAAR